MTLRLDDQETAALRRRAELEGRSMQEVARAAVREYIERVSRRELLDQVLDEELPRYAEVRDHGLLESALARPRATVFGDDAYASIHEKAAALLHSLARNHALVDGNKRLALAGTIAFYGVNGLRLTLTNDEAYELVIRVSSGQLDDVDAIATVLRKSTRPRR
jgi:death on curing protein